MRKAIQYFESGDLPRAHKNVTKYLSIDPTNADANHLSGLIALQTGKPDAAASFIARAPQANPRIAMAHNNLGEANRALGKFDEAKASYRRAIALEPAVAGFRNNLGIVLMAQGRANDAIDVYQDALAAEPRDAMIHTNLGNALMESGDIEGAIAAQGRALKLHPSSAEARSSLGIAQQINGDFEAARNSFEIVLKSHPEHEVALSHMARTLETLGDASEAAIFYRRMIDVNPDDEEAYLSLASLYRSVDRPDDGVEILEQYLALHPDNAKVCAGISFVWRAVGNKDKAMEAARRALVADPDCALAHAALAQARRHETLDEELEATVRLRERRDLPLEDRVPINFSLGKAYEELGDHDAAIGCYMEGNRLKRSEMTYSPDETALEMAEIRDVFSKDYFTGIGDAGSQDETPIFILGMPRSGTSLVEQIISSHSAVCGAGELETLARVIQVTFARDETKYPRALLRSPPDTLRAIGDSYVETIRRNFGESERISDKMLHNFLHVGLIRAALPHAKVIHCRRHPVDTCLSIYKNNFANAHNYAFDMVELGGYYRAYRDLMAHWRTVLPGFMYEISYEALVDDTEVESRGLLEFCNLEWEPACLEFYKTRRVVNTISASQVRQPIYKGSVALWKRYEDHLQPLIEALGDAIEN